MKRIFFFAVLALSFFGTILARANSADTVYQNLTVMASSYLDTWNLSRTDSASTGAGAWRIGMSAVSHDSVSRYLALIKNITPIAAPAAILVDLKVPLWLAPRRVRVAVSFFRNGVPVANSNLDTISASAEYQTHTFQLPAVTGQVNQFVVWISLLYGEKGNFTLLLDNVVAGATVFEDGESGPSGPDVTPPGTPINAALTATSATSADAVTTAPNDPDLASVVFEIDTGSIFPNPVRVAAFAVPGVSVTTTFLDLTPNTLYYLRVAARDTAGNQSPFSAVDTARTFVLAEESPDIPSGFSLTAISESSVAAVFLHGTGATQTEVQLAEGFSVGSRYTAKLISGTPGMRGEIIFEGLEAGRIYAARARSLNVYGVSLYTETDTAHTLNDHTPPPPVGDLVANPISGTQTEVKFSVPSSVSDVALAVVQWSTASDFRAYRAWELGVSSGAVRVVIRDLSPGTIYWFRVKLRDRNGNESLSSNVDTARTSGVTGVENDGLPQSYFLAQNYPNPFNPSTTIEFALPEPSFVRLAVYNAIGQEVAVILSEEKFVGTYRIVWDASALPSGAYFSRLETKKFVQTKKMLFIK